MPEDHFGEPVAARYDDDVAEMFDASVVEPAVDFLAQLAGRGRALEFGIGTGRLALPLAARGVSVAGIDLSEAMVARLRAKPGGKAIEVTIGDFATARVAGRFAVVYLVFNTIMNLTSADQQIACFANAAAHLAPGGCFMIEVGVPQLRRLLPGERFDLFDMSDSHVGIDEYDPATQRSFSHHFTRGTDGRFELRSFPFRFVWPSELDLMARLAGMSSRERWANFERAPFTADSRSHVSVWEKPGDRAPDGPDRDLP